MAVALVGSIGAVSTAINNVTPAFAQSTTAGNLLIAWVVTDLAAPSAPTGWTLAAQRAVSGYSGIFYKPNCSASETAPTFTAGSSQQWAALAEFSGVATTSPIDQTGSNSVLSASPCVAVCAAADTAAAELVVTSSRHKSSKAETITSTDTYNNGATPTSNLNNDATSDSNHYRFAWGVTTGKSAADQNSAANTSMNISIIAVAVASFKLPGAAVATKKPRVLSSRVAAFRAALR